VADQVPVCWSLDVNWMALHAHVQLTIYIIGDMVLLCFIKQVFISVYDYHSDNRIILLFHFWNNNHTFYSNLIPTVCKERLLPLLHFL
jgi:hypothetical protein